MLETIVATRKIWFLCAALSLTVFILAILWRYSTDTLDTAPVSKSSTRNPVNSQMWRLSVKLSLLVMIIGVVSFAEEGEDMPIGTTERLWQAVTTEDYAAYIAARQEMLVLPEDDFSTVVVDLRQREDWRARFLADGLEVRRADPEFAADFDDRLEEVAPPLINAAGLPYFRFDEHQRGRDLRARGLLLEGEARIPTCMLALEMTLVPMPLDEVRDHDPDLLRAELMRRCIWAGPDQTMRIINAHNQIAKIMQSPPSWYPPYAAMSSLSSYRLYERRVRDGIAEAPILESYRELALQFMEQYQRQHEHWSDRDILYLIRFLNQLSEIDERAQSALDDLRADDRAASAFESFAEEQRRQQDAEEAHRRWEEERRQAAEQAARESEGNSGDHGREASEGSDTNQD